MVVLLEKRLTERQQWVLEYLADLPSYRRRTSAHGWYDDGLLFIQEYAGRFDLKRKDAPIDLQRSLERVLKSLMKANLVDSRSTSNHGGIGTHDHGPSHCNEYWITNRGRRAAISHATYDGDES